MSYFIANSKIGFTTYTPLSFEFATSWEQCSKFKGTEYLLTNLFIKCHKIFWCFLIMEVLEILHMWRRFHIAKILRCGLAYNAWWVPNTTWFWERMNLIKCVYKSTLITRGFVGRSPWAPCGCIRTSGPMGDHVMNCHGT